MPYWVECGRCGRKVPYDVPDEIVCPDCGWSDAEERSEFIAKLCERFDEDYASLLRDLGDDEAIESYLTAMYVKD